MTTGNYDLQINWPSGRHSSAGTITDEQWGEVARILSPDWQASAVSVQPAGEVPEIKRYWLRLDDIGGHESMVRASDMDRMIAKRDARIVELEEQRDRFMASIERKHKLMDEDAAEIDKLRDELVALKDAATTVLDGLNERIAYAVEQRQTTPVFEGIAALHSALYAAPVSEAKAQGVVMPEPLTAAITRADDVLHAISSWDSSSVKLEQRHGSEWAKEVDAIRRELHTQLARLNAAPVQQVSVPVACSCGMEYPANSYSAGFISGSGMCEVCDAAMPPKDIPQQVSVPDVSAMARILADRNADACNVNREDNWAIYGQDYIDDVTAMLAAAPAAPAADASDVLDQAMYTLISIGYHENSGLVHELRQALAAHSAK